MSQGVVPAELDNLANEVGEFICYWGFKKVHGRIWTHLFLSGEALDAGELIQRLKVSKALISLSLNDLLRHEVILESAKSPRGTQTYVANPDVLSVIMNVLKKRERQLLLSVKERHEHLTQVKADQLNGSKICSERLQSLGQLINQSMGCLEAMLNFSSMDFAALTQFNSKN